MRGRVDQYLTSLALRGVMGAAMRAPYARRIPAVGLVGSRMIAPLAGHRRIIRENLDLVCPELPEQEKRRLVRVVPDNTARALAEIYSGEEFKQIAARAPIRGEEGLAALREAHEAGRPVIVVSGHIGHYDVPLVRLGRLGFRAGGLYRPPANPYLLPDYERAVHAISPNMFARGRRGLAGMVRFLRRGGMLGLLTDQRVSTGAPLRFFGHTAYTPLSAAELALKYDALVVPAYGIRQPDGLSFELVIEPPIAPAAPEPMTQAMNDSLERQVRRHMDQWLWQHRRWKRPGRARD